MAQDFTSWIGRSITREDLVTERLRAEFRATLSPFLFEMPDGACPPGFHYGLAPATPLPEETGADGAERNGVFLPPIPLPRRMWGGGVIETHGSLKPGARVTRTSTVSDIRHKQGSSGALCLVSITHDIADEGGLVIRERQDLVFREAPTAPAAGPGAVAAFRADWHVDPSPILLFRFSAFTFNGHRIHYDLRHAEEEGYPNLLVHGPMQAALMLNLAAVTFGHVPERLEYRCLAPLYAGGRFGVSCEGSTLRVIRSDGVTTAEGQARAQGTG